MWQASFVTTGQREAFAINWMIFKAAFLGFELAVLDKCVFACPFKNFSWIFFKSNPFPLVLLVKWEKPELAFFQVEDWFFQSSPVTFPRELTGGWTWLFSIREKWMRVLVMCNTRSKFFTHLRWQLSLATRLWNWAVIYPLASSDNSCPALWAFWQYWPSMCLFFPLKSSPNCQKWSHSVRSAFQTQSDWKAPAWKEFSQARSPPHLSQKLWLSCWFLCEKATLLRNVPRKRGRVLLVSALLLIALRQLWSQTFSANCKDCLHKSNGPSLHSLICRIYLCFS